MCVFCGRSSICKCASFPMVVLVPDHRLSFYYTNSFAFVAVEGRGWVKGERLYFKSSYS